MRVLGFSKKWAKLQIIEFTTFRLPRRDKGWMLGERVQVVFNPRSKDREILGIADIVRKEQIWLDQITDLEAEKDGFPGGVSEMFGWLNKAHDPERLDQEPLNKLTLRWIKG
jgi:hypothetical protein